MIASRSKDEATSLLEKIVSRAAVQSSLARQTMKGSQELNICGLLKEGLGVRAVGTASTTGSIELSE